MHPLGFLPSAFLPRPLARLDLDPRYVRNRRAGGPKTPPTRQKAERVRAWEK